jgi:hypothetical protein
MDKLKRIAELVKRRKAILDDCVQTLRTADAATDSAPRQVAVDEAAGHLRRVRELTQQIDELYGTQIDELQKLRAEAAVQGADAISAAQGAITRLVGIS